MQNKIIIIIDIITLLLLLLLPIKIVWQWPILGIIVATVFSQILATFSHFLTTLLKLEQVSLDYQYNSDYWEFWWISLFFIIGYCLFISFCKGFYLLIKKFFKN